MPEIKFLPSEAVVEVAVGTDLLAAARLAQVEIDSPCGGEGKCGKCIVRIVDGHVRSSGHHLLPAAAAGERYVLACQTRLGDTPATVEVPPPTARGAGKFWQDEGCPTLDQLLPAGCRVDPLAWKISLRVPAPQAEDGLGDLERLVRALRGQLADRELLCPLGSLRELADALRAEDGLVTATLSRQGEKQHLVRIEAGDTTGRLYAAAIDVGTTTVSVRLIDLAARRLLPTCSAYNGQVTCGPDVISRINYARRPGGAEELRSRVLATVNGLLAEAAAGCGAGPADIAAAVVSGNTTMLHLMLALKCEYIRLAPYTPTVMSAPDLAAGEVGIGINDRARVFFSPNVGSYVGGDITAGLLCTPLAGGSDRLTMFIDIGTNGELVVGNDEFLLGCACSAGPAFEGGGIEAGMRAADGAIEKVQIDPDTGACRPSVIGGVKPAGICGSGMIDLVASLFLTGWLDPAGKLNRDRRSPCIQIDRKQASYVVAPADQTATGRPVAVGEVDIQNVIRAKAAVYSASALMLEQIGKSFDDLAEIYVAGGFGRFLDLDKAIVLGLLPDLPTDRFRFVGNASLMGSCMVVASRDCRQRQRELARRMTYFDLSTTPSYMTQYTGALFLPHTERERFPSVTEALARALG